MSATARRSLKDRIVDRASMYLPDSFALRLQYWRAHGRLPRLVDPQLFTELVQFRKLFELYPLYSLLSDKILAKEYVDSRLGPGWTIPTLWNGSTLPSRDLRNWPKPFVLKPNFGSGFNHFVFGPADEHERLEALAEKWLSEPYSRHNRERYHDKIRRQLLVEPYIAECGVAPIDYKFYCFNGEVECILACVGRESNLSITTFGPSWEKTDIEFTPPTQAVPPPPQSLEQMKSAASLLSSGLAFVRIDFYEIGGRGAFGEFTFTPSSGFRPFFPLSYDEELGLRWRRAKSELEQSTAGFGSGLRDDAAWRGSLREG